jgi:uncharacterized OB-fold protein
MNALAIIDMPGRRAYPPRESKFTQKFWDQLREGRFTTTQCDDCGRLTFPPKPFCPHCWSKNVRWVDAPSTGTVYSHTTIHVAPAIFAHEAPYRVCIADLDGRLRIATRLVQSDADMPLDTPIEVVILRYEDGMLFAVRQHDRRS